MKSTEAFKDTILNHLQDKAISDSQFALSFVKDDRNIDDCITYILNKVKNSGCNGFIEAEIYAMAEEYYTLETVEVGSRPNARIVVNQHVEAETKEPSKKADKPKAKEKPKAKPKPAMKVVVNNTTEAKPTDKPKLFEPTLF